jgi:pyruvate dehydrogenase phosphatase
MGVFDGHGGGACAEVISQRLFNYICLALSPDPVKFLTETQPMSVVKNLVFSPKPEAVTPYDEKGTSHVRDHVTRNEVYFLARYAEKLIRSKSSMTTEDKIKDAFKQCDQDLSEEIQYNLASPNGIKSNLLKHYYLSLAVSGCCANVVVLHDNKLFVANTGDCRAVMAYEEKDSSQKVILLSYDHNSDNVSELKRIFDAHPKIEQNNIIRYNRLLGQLMPLRAFGDFGYKWPVSVIRQVGLIKAFGPRVIPPFYHTPPYLIADPEVTSFDLKTLDDAKHSFLIMATDGLWEQFGSSREVTDVLWRYHRLNKSLSNQGEESSLENEDTIELPPPPSDNQGALQVNSKDDEVPVEDIDGNQATYLLRSSLCQSDYDHSSVSGSDAHDIRRFIHHKLVAELTLPASVVRNFRDDISLIVVRF